MAGKLFIDGQDAYTSYGLDVEHGGYCFLPEFPSLKNIDTNDWPEENGLEVDWGSVTLNPHEFSVSFAFLKPGGRESFVRMLSETALYHVWQFAEAGRTVKLRIVSEVKWQDCVIFKKFSLKFADDFPYDYVYAAPSSSIANVTPGTLLNGVDLGSYGIAVLEGTKDSVEKEPDVKPNLSRNIQALNGTIYSDTDVHYKQKDVKLNLLMRASTLTEFWRNRNALLSDLTAKSERLLYFNGRTYQYYYKGCSSKRFHPLGKIWFEFNLNLCITGIKG